MNIPNNPCQSCKWYQDIKPPLITPICWVRDQFKDFSCYEPRDKYIPLIGHVVVSEEYEGIFTVIGFNEDGTVQCENYEGEVLNLTGIGLRINGVTL